MVRLQIAQGPIAASPSGQFYRDDATWATPTGSGSGRSPSFAYVGPYSWCDYVTDGVDDAVQIAQAYAAGYHTVILGGSIVVSGSNPIVFPTGTSSGNRLTGMEYYHTYITLQSGTSGPIISLTQNGIELDHFTLLGGKTSHVTGDYGINWTAGNQNKIHDVRMSDTGDIGLSISISGSGGASTIRDNFIFNSFGSAVSIGSGTGDLELTHNELCSHDGYTPLVLAAPHTTSIGNHVWVTPQVTIPSSMILVSCTGSVLIGNYIDFFMYGGIWITGSRNVIQGNHMWQPVYNGAYAITLDSGATYNTILGNTAENNASYMAYGCHFSSGANYNIAIGNSFNAATAPILDSGTGNQTGYNI